MRAQDDRRGCNDRSALFSYNPVLQLSLFHLAGMSWGTFSKKVIEERVLFAVGGGWQM